MSELALSSLEIGLPQELDRGIIEIGEIRAQPSTELALTELELRELGLGGGRASSGLS